MAQFYTDPSGHIFTLKEIFSNYGEAFADIGLSWQSPISAGEYVLISYGDRNSSSYQTNANIDLTNDKGYTKKSWNGVLLQKVYNTATEELEYKELVNYTGYTPQINFIYESLSAGEDPYFDYKTSGTVVDKQGISHICSYETPWALIGIPKAQGVTVEGTVPETSNTPPLVKSEISEDNSKLLLTFHLPKMWGIETGAIHRYEADVTEITIDDVSYPLPFVKVREGEDHETKYIDFYLNKNQTFDTSITVTQNDSTSIPTANLSPTTGDLSKLHLTLNLPANYKFVENSFTASMVRPTQPATVHGSTTGDYNEILHYALNIPRTTTVYLLNNVFANLENYSNESVSVDRLGNNLIDVGDICIDQTTWAVHKITNATYYEDEITPPQFSTEYIGTFKLNTPEVATTKLEKLYDEDGNAIAPTAEAESDPTNPNNWKITFGLPYAPEFDNNGEFTITPADSQDNPPKLELNPVKDSKKVQLSGRLPYAQIDIGQVITGDPGSDAKVELRENSESSHPVWDFTIPRGNKGPYYTPSVNATTGELTWAKSDSTLDDIPVTNIRGPQGYSIAELRAVSNPEDPKGVIGNYYTPYLNDPASTALSTICAPRGEQGFGLKIVGKVSDPDSLPPLSDDDLGIAYRVTGTAEGEILDPPHIYIFIREDGANIWQDFGPIEGPRGKGIKAISLDANTYRLIFTYDDDTTTSPVTSVRGPAPKLTTGIFPVTITEDDSGRRATATVQETSANQYSFDFAFYNISPDTWIEIPHVATP